MTRETRLLAEHRPEPWDAPRSKTEVPKTVAGSCLVCLVLIWPVAGILLLLVTSTTDGPACTVGVISVCVITVLVVYDSLVGLVRAMSGRTEP